MTAGPSEEDRAGERAGRFARAEVSADGAANREIRVHGSGGALIPEGWPVAGDGG